MSLLELQNLSVRIGETPVLNNISLKVEEGEVVALTGESGSGKSMTALAAMQLLPRGAETTGTIRLAGQDLAAFSEAELCRLRGKVASMVFQEPMTALNPVQPIGQQVAEGLMMHANLGRRDAFARAEDTLSRVGLPPDRVPMRRFPHELSGGQRQRVVIAIAMALKPKLLIADEPTTALDVTTQAQILQLLKRLAREDGMGLVLITHDLAVVANMADRIAVMENGRIVEEAATERLLQHREHPYTRKLFAATAHEVDLPPAMETAPLLEATGVTRRYNLPRRNPWRKAPTFTAVRNVSFTLHKQERLGLVGESGCGKSTLTRALLGLEPLQAGQIKLGGMPVTADRSTASVSRLQVVFQDPFGSFNPRHRVARLITEPFHLLPNPPQGAARTQAVSEALEAVGLAAEDQHRFIHEFSGGQRQRVAIARALITRPEAIILDEAVSALDVSVRAQILDLLANLCRTAGLTYIFISHDLSVVRRVTDRVLVMRAGEIVEQGPTEAVFTNPQHEYTKLLVSAAPRLPDSAGLTG